MVEKQSSITNHNRTITLVWLRLYTFANVRSWSFVLASVWSDPPWHADNIHVPRGHTLVSENISFNVPYVWHVPSIDRGRRLARVYKPSLSSIKRVLGCNLAIIRVPAMHLRRTTRTYACVLYMCGTRLRARMYVCASHDGCVFCGRLDALPRGLCEASPPARLATDFTRIGRAVE